MPFDRDDDESIEIERFRDVLLGMLGAVLSESAQDDEPKGG